MSKAPIFKRGDLVIYQRFDDEHIECTFSRYNYEFTHPCLILFPLDGSNYFLAPKSKVVHSPNNLFIEKSREQFETHFRAMAAADPHVDLLLEQYNHGTEDEPVFDYYGLSARDGWTWWLASSKAFISTCNKEQLGVLRRIYGLSHND